MAINRSKAWRIVRWILVIYIVLGFALYYLQDQILFHPKALPANRQFSFNQPFIELNLPLATNRNLNVIRFTVDSNQRKGIVLFFHGNKDNIEHYASYAPLFTKQGYEAWFMDYPGFGKSTGERKETLIYEDASLVYKMAISQFPSEKIIIYGKSFGTGVAAQLASVRDCKELILETPYYSIESLARHYFPIYPSALVKYEFPVHEYLQSVRAPVYIFHGTDDGVVPYKQSKKLAEENKKINLITIEHGSHNDLLQFEAFRKGVEGLL